MNSITRAVFNELLECGKKNGKLTSQQINNAIEEIDVDIDQLYDFLERDRKSVV